jgi:zinc transporter, ZIP family
MTFSETAALGAFAGSTIFLGLPLGRVRSLSVKTRGFLGTLSAGILVFILWDVLTQAIDTLGSSLATAQAGGSWTSFVLRGATFGLTFAVGAVGLGWVEQRFLGRSPAPIVGGAIADATTSDLESSRRREALMLGMMIAVAIGAHNFSEGLAIGVSARAGEVALAGTLIVGFAAHNATEGFGIVGPLGGVRPSWGWLFGAGAIAGGPTLLGTLVGYHVTSAPLELAFYALAAGGILYVVGQIWGSAQRTLAPTIVLAGLVLGFLLGLASDLIITAGGG